MPASDVVARLDGITAPVRRVLVVDDDQDSAEGLAMLCRLAGHAVDIAHDGPTAIEKANPINKPSNVRAAAWTTPKSFRWSSCSGRNRLRINPPTSAENQSVTNDSPKTRTGEFRRLFIFV